MYNSSSTPFCIFALGGRVVYIPKSNLTNKIIKMLDSENIVYDIFEHAPVMTSLEAAKVRGEPLKIGAKAIIFFADKIPILVVVPGDRKIDTKIFKSIFDIKDLRMATKEEVLSIATVEVGGVPPIGSAMGIKTYCDEEVLVNEKIAFNAGSRGVTIKMRSFDYKNIEKPIIGKFSFVL